MADRAVFTAAVAAGLANKRSYNVTIKYEKTGANCFICSGNFSSNWRNYLRADFRCGCVISGGRFDFEFQLGDGRDAVRYGNWLAAGQLHQASSSDQLRNERNYSGANWWKFGDADVFGIRFYAFALANFCRHKSGDRHLYWAGNSAFNEDVSGVRAQVFGEII